MYIFVSVWFLLLFLILQLSVHPNQPSVQLSETPLFFQSGKISKRQAKNYEPRVAPMKSTYMKDNSYICFSNIIMQSWNLEHSLKSKSTSKRQKQLSSLKDFFSLFSKVQEKVGMDGYTTVKVNLRNISILDYFRMTLKIVRAKKIR